MISALTIGESSLLRCVRLKISSCKIMKKIDIINRAGVIFALFNYTYFLDNPCRFLFILSLMSIPLSS